MRNASLEATRQREPPRQWAPASTDTRGTTDNRTQKEDRHNRRGEQRRVEAAGQKKRTDYTEIILTPKSSQSRSQASKCAEVIFAPKGQPVETFFYCNEHKSLVSTLRSALDSAHTRNIFT